MKKVNYFKKYSVYTLLAATMFFASCDSDDDAPEPENEVEVITDVTLVFTNIDDTTDVVQASAQDPDGEGAQELVIADEITLDTSKTYELTFEIFNNLETPGEDIGEEIFEEDNEHQLFFSFSDNSFATPIGDGNIDNAADSLNYSDNDENGNPVGLVTSWTTPSTQISGGIFTARLQHQPDLKTATTGADDGDTDFDLEFVLNIQ